MHRLCMRVTISDFKFKAHRLEMKKKPPTPSGIAWKIELPGNIWTLIPVLRGELHTISKKCDERGHQSLTAVNGLD